MPNLILKSNIANKTFNAQHKVLRMPVQPGVVELIITPTSRYSIDAKDFSSGLLPREVSKVEYQNLGEKVIARVFIKSTIDAKQPVNIFIPISGRSFVKKDSFTITETTRSDERVFVSDLSPNSKSIDGSKTTYSINNDLGKKSLLFTKKFLVGGDNYFSTEPSYVIKNNSSRYTVTSHVTTNSKGQINSKSFDVFYTSPNAVFNSVNTELLFTAKSGSPEVRVGSVVAVKKEDEAIYSVDYGRSIGKEGGVKKISVKGVPGTTFRFLISNSDNDTYNAKTGAFEAGGGIVEGIIPIQSDGAHYGEWVLMLRVPKTITTQAITIQLVDEAPINHDTITSVATATAATSSAGGTPQVLEISVTTLNINVNAEDATIGNDFVSEVNGEVSTIMLGEGGGKQLVLTGDQDRSFDVVVVSFIVLGYQDKFIQIARQPLFLMPDSGEDNFVAWDSGGGKAEGTTSTGVQIVSDWDFDVVGADEGLEFGLSMNSKLTATGLGEITAGNGAYQAVLIEGILEVSNIGKRSSTVELNLHNFLTQVDPS